MADVDVDDWYALLTVPPAGERRQGGEIAERLAALDDATILSGIASRMIRENARRHWYIEPVCDRLPAPELSRIAEAAVHAREEGANEAADSVIAYVSVHQPEALAPHLRSLWDIRPNSSSYYSGWPWRAADDAEVARLLEIARSAAGPDADFAIRCLLETRRPDVLAQLPTDPAYLAWVGYGPGGDGALAPLHPAAVWHIAFPASVLDEWADRHPLRARQSSWPARSGSSGSRHLVSGFTGRPCPKCGHPLHRLLRLDPVPAGLGISSQDRVEFLWCPGLACAGGWYARHGADGTPAEITVAPGPPGEDLGSMEDWFIAEAPVDLVRLGERWRRQDWALSNGRENLHRVGGAPTWIQYADYRDCPDCARTMRAVAQIAVEDLWDAEGMCYLQWCDDCAVSAVVYQQT